MTVQQSPFSYNNIELYKSESLGSGSYGGVCRAKCDGLICAAKIIHPTLFDLQDPGVASYLRKFQEECHLLSLARHPNIVQYLATYYDPDTRLPVLLMELCDESLTQFLERSPGPLPYHLQVKICLDIALALVYLHSNGLIHRDLTGNNVLMIAGTRAKITDFGMSKLATLNPRMTALTLCPGNLLYMSPEALDKDKSYTDKLDVFSYGVILIQILTRQFPNPTDRLSTVYAPQFDGEVRLVVPETKRRKSHLRLIPDTHSLKPLALQCLKKEMERPSALQLSERLSELKQAPQYAESVYQEQAQSRKETGNEINTLRGQAQELQQQNTHKERPFHHLSHQGHRILTEVETRGASEHQGCSTPLQNILEENQHTIKMKDRLLQEKERVIEAKERQLQQTKDCLKASQQLVFDLQQSLQQQNKAITYLQQTISSYKRKVGQMNQQDTDSSSPTLQKPIAAEETHVPVSVAQKGISKMTLMEGKKVPERMMRGAATVYGNTAYFRPSSSARVYAYKNIFGKDQWSRLPDNPNKGFSLAFIDGLLTSVGGYNTTGCTKTLLSLKREGEGEQWCEVFPPMPTPRFGTACIITEHALVVAGGFRSSDLDNVELMNIDTKQWTQVCPLPQKLVSLSGIARGNSLYLAGGFNGISQTKSVFTCSLNDLLHQKTFVSRVRETFSRVDKVHPWKQIDSLPVKGSTLALLSGHLLAIGGQDDTRNSTTDVYRYDSHTDSWCVIIQMKYKRSLCFAVTLPIDKLVIVGSCSNEDTGNLEILEELLQ